MSTAILLPEKTADLSPAQKNWITLAVSKDSLFKSLANKELVVQGFLNGIELKTDLAAVQLCISQAVAAAAEAKDERLQFTNVIKERIVEPAMAFEKRNDALIINARAHELKVREAEANKTTEANKLQSEEERFKAHFVNQFFLIAADYRNVLEKTISDYYIVALEKKLTSAKALKEFKEGIVVILRNIVPGKPAAFVRVQVTKERAAELFADITKYNHIPDLEAAIKSIDQKFALYSEDLKNAKAAAEKVKAESEEKINRQNEAAQVEVATNNLIASASNASISGPVVKVLRKVVEKETEQFALQVITESLKRWNDIKQYIKVKKWTNLSIGQMADALGKHITETGIAIAGLETEEVKK